jgi:hypothetical protein
MSKSGNNEQNTAKNQNLNGNFLSVIVWPNARGIKACVNGVGNLESPFLLNLLFYFFPATQFILINWH